MADHENVTSESAYKVGVNRIPGQPFISIMASAPVVGTSITLHYENIRELCFQALHMCNVIEAEGESVERHPSSILRPVHNGRTTKGE